jgi:hypothetical protein
MGAASSLRRGGGTVNLSPVQFKKGNLPQMVFATLASSGLPAARLELEITESIFLANSETNLATLRRLHALGVGISMDDFGTGYSGLSYLRAFPFDKITTGPSFPSLASAGIACQLSRRSSILDRASAFPRWRKASRRKTSSKCRAICSAGRFRLAKSRDC